MLLSVPRLRIKNSALRPLMFGRPDGRTFIRKAKSCSSAHTLARSSHLTSDLYLSSVR